MKNQSSEFSKIFNSFVDYGEHIPLHNINDNIQFTCNKCGKCCTNLPATLVTGLDLFRIAKQLNMECHEAHQKYFMTTRVEASNMPFLSFKSVNDVCPFYKNNKCSIYSVRPTICRYYPVLSAFDPTNGKVVYYRVNDESCSTNDSSESPNLKQWLNRIDSTDKRYMELYWDLIFKAAKIEIMMEKSSLSIEQLECLYGTVFIELYWNYNMKSDFERQAKKNFQTILSDLSMAVNFGIIPERIYE